jgi:hypothetical protein
MVWFKVDDKLHDKPKTRQAKKAAMGVWVLAGSWSADNLTDGFIPVSVLSRWGTRADATRLVDADLWRPDEQDGEKGWRFVDWDRYQPMKEKVLAEREVKAEAGRKGGKASGVSRQANAKQSASSLVEPPTRPVPTDTAAAASARGGGPALTGEVRVFADKLRAVPAFRDISFDVDQQKLDEIHALVLLHGDQRLITNALTSSFHPVPSFVSAFLTKWRALSAPGTGLVLVEDRCHECSLTIAACDAKHLTDPEFCPRKDTA